MAAPIMNTKQIQEIKDLADWHNAVIEYSMKVKRDIYASDISNKLDIPYDEVCKILDELVTKGAMDKIPLCSNRK